MNKAKQKASGSKRRHTPSGVRPFWAGSLTFGLVNVPVHLYPANRSSDVSFRMLAPDGAPLARRYYCPGHDADIHAEHLIRGYELENGEYVVVRDEDLEAAAPDKSREIDLRQFVDIDQVPAKLFEKPYLLTPAGESNKAYRLLAMAMERTGLVGIATFVMRDREYLVAILAEGGILKAQTLRFADEIRSPKDIGLPKPRKADKRQSDVFARTITRMSIKSLAEIDLKDPYRKRVDKLVARNRKETRNVVRIGSPDSRDEEGSLDSDDSVDLLETIRRGLANKDRHSSGGRQRQSSANKLSDLSKDELYDQAQQLDIPGRSGMSKEALKQAILKKDV